MNKPVAQQEVILLKQGTPQQRYIYNPYKYAGILKVSVWNISTNDADIEVRFQDDLPLTILPNRGRTTTTRANECRITLKTSDIRASALITFFAYYNHKVRKGPVYQKHVQYMLNKAEEEKTGYPFHTRRWIRKKTQYPPKGTVPRYFLNK